MLSKMSLTMRALSSFPLMTLNACRTQSPAIMALVVAMAGMILPAISVDIYQQTPGGRITDTHA